jgi:hypothetical protein
MKARFQVKGIREFEKFLEKQPAAASKAAQLAINDVTRKTFARSRREILRQVNLTAAYLDGQESSTPRFRIRQLATQNNLMAVIEARRRPTSLARFDARQLYGPAKRGGTKKSGVSVNVGGSRKKIPRAFLVNLKRGAADGGNTGVAIRVPAGQGVTGRKFKGVPFGGSNSRDSDVYLLYGPSVQQVFDDVAVEQEAWAQDRLEAEFSRQYARLSNG